MGLLEGREKMRDDYLDEKLEDINSKNISKEEKKEKIKKQKRNNVIIICFIVLFLLCFFSQLSIEKDENLLIYYEYIMYIEMFLLILFYIYLALTSKEGKKSRKKRSWKNIKSQESDSLQDLCENSKSKRHGALRAVFNVLIFNKAP